MNNVFLAGETIDLCVPGEDFADWLVGLMIRK